MGLVEVNECLPGAVVYGDVEAPAEWEESLPLREVEVSASCLVVWYVCYPEYSVYGKWE